MALKKRKKKKKDSEPEVRDETTDIAEYMDEMRTEVVIMAPDYATSKKILKARAVARHPKASPQSVAKAKAYLKQQIDLYGKNTVAQITPESVQEMELDMEEEKVKKKEEKVSRQKKRTRKVKRNSPMPTKEQLATARSIQEVTKKKRSKAKDEPDEEDEEDASEEETGEEDVSQKKASRLWLIILLTFIVLGGGGAAAYFFLL